MDATKAQSMSDISLTCYYIQYNLKGMYCICCMDLAQFVKCYVLVLFHKLQGSGWGGW